jgi:hypothetical protein
MGSAGEAVWYLGGERVFGTVSISISVTVVPSALQSYFRPALWRKRRRHVDFSL